MFPLKQLEVLNHSTKRANEGEWPGPRGRATWPVAATWKLLPLAGCFFAFFFFFFKQTVHCKIGAWKNTAEKKQREHKQQ